MTATTHHTMCPMNCHPTLCGMQVTVAQDQLTAVAGDPDNPDSEGFLCVRGHAAQEIVENPRRLLNPLMRDHTSEPWRETSWEVAMAHIAHKLNKAGNEHVAIWNGHGEHANDYGVFGHNQLTRRFANQWGCHVWSGAMICWGMGGFGLGLTGPMQTNTKEDMSAHADLIIVWGANLVSQPNTARHLSRAKKRGAKVIAIDIRASEACRSASEHFIISPGTDAALALAMAHVIVEENRHHQSFIDAHSLGFDEFREHLKPLTPQWAESITGIDAKSIRALARQYAETPNAMIVLGGSSMYKDGNGWLASRAISCLPALTGKLGRAGAGFGPRHGAASHGFALNDISALADRPTAPSIPGQMSAIVDAINTGALDALLLFGANFLSSFADSGRIEQGLGRLDLVVGHDLFMNETLERFAHVVLPATSWLEDVGIKGTQTHVYLMDRVLTPRGDTRAMHTIVKDLATRLELDDFYPWTHEFGHLDAVLDTPCTGHATVSSLRTQGAKAALDISHVAHPDHQYPTPSGKIEFYSEQAKAHGLPPLPVFVPRPETAYPLELRYGRSMNHFHAFYEHGRALPALVRRDPGPVLWVSQGDATARHIEDGATVQMFNERGTFTATAKVTDRINAGTLWIHDGWEDLNSLSDGAPVLPDSATSLFAFSTGQSRYDTMVDVRPAP
ncbi:MAG: anaerobic selenocysteine-containing dehydrogenase [Gammaproteobacteria bacterium]|jgi:anaerobic selenocysteine-containing dehydrogenase